MDGCISLFDANVTLGRHLKLRPGGPHSAADLLADMDQCGIAEALVVDALARENHPLDGNERVLQAIAGQPRLHAGWAALLAAGVDEQPVGEALLAQMRAHRVGAVFLYPQQYRFSLASWCVDAFLEPLAAAGVPVFINPNEVGPGGYGAMDATPWDEVVDLCRRWPTLPVIVSEYRVRRTQRLIYRALEACPNLRLELSGWWLHRGIEYICQRWGASRLLFGSNWPACGAPMTLATLTCADIDDADKRLIAGDNLRALLRWSDPVQAEVTLPPADAYVAYGQSGIRPPEMRFADCHGHMGPHAAHYHLPGASLDGMLADLDRFGVEKICIFGFTGVFSDEQPGNDLVAAAVRRAPERFIGFTMLNPHRGRDAMLRELERGAAMGLRGIKLIPHYQGYPPEGELIDVACAWANERRQIILNHHWGSARQVERLVSTYPDACFFTGHSTAEYAEVMARHDNLYVCSCPLLEPQACEHLVAAIGADRLLFGSDLEDLPIAWGLGPILFARLSVEDKELVLGGNLRRLLKRFSI
jgi:predicted TIM-barrel fold metal-dependent hydrolase